MPVNAQPASAFRQTSDGRLVRVTPQNPNTDATQTEPRWDLLKNLEEPLAVDIEFQTSRHEDAEKWSERIGHIGIVNTRGDLLYDTYVRYDYDPEVKVNMGLERFGVTYEKIRLENGALSIHEVKVHINKIMAGRTIILHGGKNDLKALLPELKYEVNFVDTRLMYGGQQGLAKLAKDKLGMVIQVAGIHRPGEDAEATMLLYLLKYPYEGRNSFKEAPFVNEEVDFPILGNTPKLVQPKASAAVTSNNNYHAIDNSDNDSTVTANPSKGKRAKGKKGWAKLDL